MTTLWVTPPPDETKDEFPPTLGEPTDDEVPPDEEAEVEEDEEKDSTEENED